MKKINAIVSLAATLMCFCLPVSLPAQKNYISIETGFPFGGPAHKIESQMNASGFGDRISYTLSDLSFIFDIFPGLGSIQINSQYPKSSNVGGKFWLRYGHELKNKNYLELSYGKIHSSKVEGFDQAGTDQLFDGNRLNYTNNVSALTAHYIFPGKNNSTGLGIGPALAFNSITREANYVSEKTNHLQPGISGSAYWRFINKKVFFMSLRGDAIMLAPVTIDAITVTSSKGYNSTFNTTKVNSFIGDLTVSAGFKF
ncbi:MAG TPA: hypothetical protein PLP23_02565 [Panacibacter sp.]|nr:hypothetical protein [Panacibacter sp.]